MGGLIEFTASGRRPAPSLPNPLADPDRAATAVLRAWVQDSELSYEQIAAEINRVAHVYFVTAGMVASWVDGISYPSFNIAMALLGLTGWVGVSVLAGLSLDG